MKNNLTPYVLSVCAAAAFLAGCGGSISPSYQPAGTSPSTRAQSVSSAVSVHDASCPGQRSFQYIGHAAHLRVPECATTIYIGAMGATGWGSGFGGEVSATIPVVPGETLIIRVGHAGGLWHGGFNGGAAGVVTHFRSHHRKGTLYGGGGGGASDVRQGGSTPEDRVVVAGGGGGEDGASGGAGGGLPDGGNGGIPYCTLPTPTGGGGGTQSSGGSGGTGSNGGSLGNGGGGDGGCFNFPHGDEYASGGGGGGYYGGGGGGNGGAGGGGSGYAEPSASNVSSQSGVNSGNGSVLICWGYSNEMCGSHKGN
jgi:Glycine rich protein